MLIRNEPKWEKSGNFNEDTNPVLFHHFIHVNTDLIQKIIKPLQSGLHTYIPHLSYTYHQDLHVKIETEHIMLYIYCIQILHLY